MKFDLHIHSNYSDWEYSPEDLILKSIDQWIEMISITDHDNLLAYDDIEKLNIGKNYNQIKIIPWVEISTQDTEGNRFHILGYWNNAYNSDMNKLCQKIQSIRTNTNYEIISLLIQKWFNIDYDLLKTKSIITKSDIAKRCLSDKINQERFPLLCHNEAVFIEWLIIPWKECFPQETEYMSPKQAIDTINNAWWISILAHPSEYILKWMKLKNIIKSMIEYGIQWFEINSWVYDRNTSAFVTHSNAISNYLKEIWLNDSMIYTWGSDFHDYEFQWHKAIPLGGDSEFLFWTMDQKIINLLSSTK